MASGQSTIDSGQPHIAHRARQCHPRQQYLEAADWLLSQDERFSAQFFSQAADFIKGFADGCPHRKEEGVLFKSLLENGIPQEGSPVAVMLHEHEMGRAFTRANGAIPAERAATQVSNRLRCLLPPCIFTLFPPTEPPHSS